MIQAQIDVIWKGGEAIKDIEKACSQVLEGAAVQVQIQAQRHVQPGIGPSPHDVPHPWIDTGNLMKSIEVGDEYREEDSMVREIGNTEQAPYGKYLEVGWRSRDGGFHRWPWLWVSLETRVGDIRQMVASLQL